MALLNIWIAVIDNLEVVAGIILGAEGAQ